MAQHLRTFGILHCSYDFLFEGIFKFLDEYYESLKREEEQEKDAKSSSPTPSTTSAQDQKQKKEKRYATETSS